MGRDEYQGVVGDASTEGLCTRVENSLSIGVLGVACGASLILVVVDKEVPSDL
jgi:hypothetical protein